MSNSKVKVAVRVRPLNQREVDLNSENVADVNGNQITLLPPSHQSRTEPQTFTYDKCFWTQDRQDPGQEEVFVHLGEEVFENIWLGYNVCVFAYGQTGSGKTFSMIGTDDQPGIVPRICSALYSRKLSDLEQTIKIEASYYEIYNEEVRDLLRSQKIPEKLKVREDRRLGPYVEGLYCHSVQSDKEIKLLLEQGNKLRAIAETKMNEQSSRSHAILDLTVTQTCHDQKSGASRELVSKVSLVDLAGSERSSKSGAQGNQFKESTNINKSLLTLGVVINSLAEFSKKKKKSQHIRYRDSVLTWLLKNSLGGNSKTIMLATVSPAGDNYQETLSTLRYADSAKLIVNQAVVNEDVNSEVIDELQKEIKRLREKLASREHIKEEELKELKLQLEEKEKLLREKEASWEEKLKRTEVATQEWQENLRKMGLILNKKYVTFRDQFYLIQQSTTLIIHHIEAATTKIGSGPSQDIQISGPEVDSEHCVIKKTDEEEVSLIPGDNSKTSINGCLCEGETQLWHENKIQIGTNVFTVHLPNRPKPGDMRASVSSNSETQTGNELDDLSNVSRTEMINNRTMEDEKYKTNSAMCASTSETFTQTNRASDDDFGYGKMSEMLTSISAESYNPPNDMNANTTRNRGAEYLELDVGTQEPDSMNNSSQKYRDSSSQTCEGMKSSISSQKTPYLEYITLPSDGRSNPEGIFCWDKDTNIKWLRDLLSTIDILAASSCCILQDRGDYWKSEVQKCSPIILCHSLTTPGEWAQLEEFLLHCTVTCGKRVIVLIGDLVEGRLEKTVREDWSQWKFSGCDLITMTQQKVQSVSTYKSALPRSTTEKIEILKVILQGSIENETRKTSFHQLVERMNMEPYLFSKLTLKNIRSIGLETVHDKPPKNSEDLPWNYLRKLMGLNRNARDLRLVQNEAGDADVCDQDDDNNDDINCSLVSGHCNSLDSTNLLDVLCVLLYCSDSFLQQEIVTKMSMCQFAVPLLLPAGDGSHCTLMLGAMRDIVKKWRQQSLADSKGFREGNVVNTSMPIFSFVRLGKSKLSKSKILNQILNTQLPNNYFIHDDMNGGNSERKISDGLVEISWYFPCGRSDVFPEPIAVTNLRGDLENSWDQFTFLTRVSSAVFIFIESISEREFRLLSTCSTKDTQYYFIITPGPAKTLSPKTVKNLKELSPILKLKKSNVLIHADKANEAAFVSKLQATIVHLLHNKPKETIISKLEEETYELRIKVDENVPEGQKAKELVREITREITDVSEYKRKNMVLQGDLWKELSKVEKEMCRMTNQGGKDTELYQDELKKKRISLHKHQYHYDLPRGLMLFIDAITHLSKTEKQHFLKCMKSDLDTITREQLSILQAEYKDTCNNGLTSKEELTRIDQKISESSLGIENFLREMGQIYEAECHMSRERRTGMRQFTRLPGIAADLLLDGFPLELIDGDASNIPLKWITDVLTELDIKTGKKCTVRVITVLGMQSTGKSILLNTMFGLQFPVASGRCTRGAFMSLINVKENFQEELGCDFILVIDTEGLKAPELASLEDSYEHDNELATLVVGLSDITIVNMGMESTTEMRDILQIVVHAFLRMKEVGKRPNCQFVHQNVNDVSAHDNNMRDRKILLEHLNEMTRVAAEMEKKNEVKTFSDVIDYSLEQDNWYIPGLWLGVPPMAPVNSEYSEHVNKLKKHLLNLMCSKPSLLKPLTIPEFVEWTQSLWNAVKHEKFIFSFRNSLVAEAYNRLCIKFSKWEWEFRKAVHDWQMSTETNTKNLSAEDLNEDLRFEINRELSNLLTGKEKEMSYWLENDFENRQENVHLIERYKQDFVLYILSLRQELERNSLKKFDEVVSIQKGKLKIQNMQSNLEKLIEDKISDLLRRRRETRTMPTDAELKEEFEEMWQKTLKDLNVEELKQRRVSKLMLHLLMGDLAGKGSAVNEALLGVKDLEDISPDFKMHEKHIDIGLWKTCKEVLSFNKKRENLEKAKDFANSLINICIKYVKEKVEFEEDYDDTYCQELLHMINVELSNQSNNLHLSMDFELDIKCHILGKASQEFQAMHNRFITENDPKRCLQNLKPGYYKRFISVLEEKYSCQDRAKQFCDQCLKPAMMTHVFQHLGQEIIEDIMISADNKKFASRTFFQQSLLKELLEEMSFKKYVDYISHYEEYTKAWIFNFIEKNANRRSLKLIQEKLISSLHRNITSAMRDDQCLQSSSVSDFCNRVCEILKKELAISQNEMQAVTFQNTAPVGQFLTDIHHFLRDTGEEILDELKSMDVKSVLSKVKVKPQDELFRKVVGCGKQCPFCKVPCEVGGDKHREHFASIHRPYGLGSSNWSSSKDLCSICTTSVRSNGTFSNSDTGYRPHPFKNYRTIYPDWAIQPDASIEISDYWKYIFAQFNEQIAQERAARPAKIPDGWKCITKEKALQSIKMYGY